MRLAGCGLVKDLNSCGLELLNLSLDRGNDAIHADGIRLLGFTFVVFVIAEVESLVETGMNDCILLAVHKWWQAAAELVNRGPTCSRD